MSYKSDWFPLRRHCNRRFAWQFLKLTHWKVPLLYPLTALWYLPRNSPLGGLNHACCQPYSYIDRVAFRWYYRKRRATGYGKAWLPLLTTHMSLLRMEMNPRLVNIVPPEYQIVTMVAMAFRSKKWSATCSLPYHSWRFLLSETSLKPACNSTWWQLILNGLHGYHPASWKPRLSYLSWNGENWNHTTCDLLDLSPETQSCLM